MTNQTSTHTQLPPNRDPRLKGFLDRPAVRSALRANAARMRGTKAALARVPLRDGLDARTLIPVLDRPLSSSPSLRALLEAETLDIEAVDGALAELAPALERQARHDARVVIEIPFSEMPRDDRR